MSDIHIHVQRHKDTFSVFFQKHKYVNTIPSSLGLGSRLGTLQSSVVPSQCPYHLYINQRAMHRTAHMWHRPSAVEKSIHTFHMANHPPSTAINFVFVLSRIVYAMQYPLKLSERMSTSDNSALSYLFFRQGPSLVFLSPTGCTLSSAKPSAP